MTWILRGKPAAYAVINPGEEPAEASLPDGEWTLLLGEDLTTVPAKGVLLVKK